MSLEMFYASIGGDYDTVKGRLATDERVEKFLNMFFGDDTYANLQASLESGDMQTAFRCAHTLKGISRDVGLTQVADIATELADALRPQEDGTPTAPEKAPELMEGLDKAYSDCVVAKDVITL